MPDVESHEPVDPVAALAALAVGQDGPFLQLYRDLHPRLLRYVRVLVGADADDVVSEAWLQMLRDADAFAGSYVDFRRWAATIARNRALDHVRRQKRRPVTLLPADALVELAATALDPADQVAEADATAAAVALIAALPRDQAEAVMLRVVLGLDARAAALVVGKRPGAVRMAAHRGLRRLASQFARAVPRPAPTRDIPRQPSSPDISRQASPPDVPRRAPSPDQP